MLLEENNKVVGSVGKFGTYGCGRLWDIEPLLGMADQGPTQYLSSRLGLKSLWSQKDNVWLFIVLFNCTKKIAYLWLCVQRHNNEKYTGLVFKGVMAESVINFSYLMSGF